MSTDTTFVSCKSDSGGIRSSRAGVVYLEETFVFMLFEQKYTNCVNHLSVILADESKL
jgi:hypothetical protein